MVVLSPGLMRAPVSDPGLLAQLGRAHLRRIAMADEVVVIDPEGYVGEATAREIAVARSLGRPIRFLSQEPLGPS